MIDYKDDDFREDEKLTDILDDGDIIHEDSWTGAELRAKIQYNLLNKWHVFLSE